MHASRIPLPANYVPLILTKRTFFTFSDIDEMNMITVISSRHLPYLCTQEGVSPRIPSNPQVHMVFAYIATFWSANQCSVSNQPISTQYLMRPRPHRVHKLQDMLHSLHSDSDQQKDNINCSPPLASSTFTSHHPLHQCVLARLRHSLHQRSPVTHCISMLSSTFKVGSFIFNACCPVDSVPLIPEVTFLLFYISDGSA